jgi:hypothetical protein
MKKPWFSILSPCIITAALVAFILILCIFSSEAYSIFAIALVLPFLLIILLIDYVTKLVLKKKIILIWVIEIIAVVVNFILFEKHYI